MQMAVSCATLPDGSLNPVMKDEAASERRWSVDPGAPDGVTVALAACRCTFARGITEVGATRGARLKSSDTPRRHNPTQAARARMHAAPTPPTPRNVTLVHHTAPSHCLLCAKNSQLIISVRGTRGWHLRGRMV